MSKKKKQNNSQPDLKCIFCGQTPLTREHFWPSWMKEVMPKSQHNHHIRLEGTHDGTKLTKPTDNNQKKVTGPPNSWQLKVVCSKCNNGWMSQIEDATKPILIALSSGEPIELTQDQQTILSKWAFLKVIIGEFDGERRVITAQERKTFYETSQIPPDWKIWIGKYQAPIWGYTYNQSNGFMEYSTDIDQKITVHKSKSAMFTIGELVIHVGKFSTEELDYSRQVEYSMIGDHEDKMVRIHPAVSKTVSWKGIVSLDSLTSVYNNLTVFTNYFKSLMHQMNR